MPWSSTNERQLFTLFLCVLEDNMLPFSIVASFHAFSCIFNSCVLQRDCPNWHFHMHILKNQPPNMHVSYCYVPRGYVPAIHTFVFSFIVISSPQHRGVRVFLNTMQGLWPQSELFSEQTRKRLQNSHFSCISVVINALLLQEWVNKSEYFFFVPLIVPACLVFD